MGGAGREGSIHGNMEKSDREEGIKEGRKGGRQREIRKGSDTGREEGIKEGRKKGGRGEMGEGWGGG